MSLTLFRSPRLAASGTFRRRPVAAVAAVAVVSGGGAKTELPLLLLRLNSSVGTGASRRHACHWSDEGMMMMKKPEIPLLPLPVRVQVLAETATARARARYFSTTTTTATATPAGAGAGAAKMSPPTQEWLVILPDHADRLEKRLEVRPKHLTSLKPQVEAGRVLFGGATLAAPLREGQAAQMTGSVMLFVAETREEVEEAVRTDPYTLGGVWDASKVQIFPFKSAVFNPPKKE